MRHQIRAGSVVGAVLCAGVTLALGVAGAEPTAGSEAEKPHATQVALPPPVRAIHRDDAVLRKAVSDELQRTLHGMALPGEEKPYFAQYIVLDSEVYVASATWGAVTFESLLPTRSLVTSLRVGSPELDSSNAGFTGGESYDSFGGAPLEDDYSALRRALWLASDADYKQALEALAQKKSALSIRVTGRKDAYPDFTLQPRHTTVSDTPLPKLEASQVPLREMVEHLSGLTTRLPGVLDSGAAVSSGATRRRLLNSEGTWADEVQVRTHLKVYATVQAADGLPLAINLDFTGNEPATLPKLEEMAVRTKEALAWLGETQQAPLAESGSAVILFEGQAAAQLVASLLAPRLAGTPPLRYIGTDADTSLASKLGWLVTSPILDVYDDPTLRKGPRGELLWGHYAADDEGVPARKVSLIERGILKTLLMSRAPRKEIRESTGHYRLYHGASIGNLIVKANQPSSRNTLLALAEAEAKKLGPSGKVYVVRRLTSLYALSGGFGTGAFGMRLDSPISIEHGAAAAEAYLVSRGKQTPVRGLLIQGIDLRALKTLVAAGGDATVLNQTQGLSSSVTAPSLLFADVDVKRHDAENPMPPSFPPPEVGFAFQPADHLCGGQPGIADGHVAADAALTR